MRRGLGGGGLMRRPAIRARTPGRNLAKHKLLLAQRAGYLPKGVNPTDPRMASQLWHSLSKNLARDSAMAGAAGPMQFLRNSIQGGQMEPMPNTQMMPGGMGGGPMVDQDQMVPPGGAANYGPTPVTWGGRAWSNPQKLYQWVRQHGGGGGSYEAFFNAHPDAANRLHAFNNVMPNRMPPTGRAALLQQMMRRRNPAMGSGGYGGHQL